MKTLKGISASPGIAIGKVFFYLDETVKIPRYRIKADEVPAEKDRFSEAVRKAEVEIQQLKSRSMDEMGEEQSKFLDSHILMLKDPDFVSNIMGDLETELKNVEWILYQVIEAFIEKLDASSDVYLRERALDFRDVAKRVLNHLLFTDRVSLADISEPVILVTHNLLPSDALALNKEMVKGIAMDAGGKTSHTAILARAFGIPAVLGLTSITTHARSGDAIIVDGNDGTVVVNPDSGTRKKYLSYSRQWQKREVELLTLNDLPAETRDGKLIKLMANIEVPEETYSAIEHGADGIGLYRSEFLFLQPGGLPTEEQQFKAYVKVLDAMKGKPVTIRTLDLGGEKAIPDMKDIDEKNPILGWRAIRFCLSNRGTFMHQLRAILRASAHGSLQTMFPMISGREELEDALEVLEEAKASLRRDGLPFDESMPVGIMIEIPSAALTSDILARKVSFFSIGTNDLIQYTIAVDRGNERIAYLYDQFHPGVLRLIRIVVENAHAAGIPVSMCGEMAGDPMATIILLGLGLDIFSMSSFTIPEVKKIIRSVSIWEAEELCGAISDMSSVSDIDRYVQGWMDERFKLATT